MFILATHAQSAVLEAVTPQLPPALAMLSRQWHQHVHATALSQIGGDGERWHMLEAALRGTEPLPSAAMIAETGEMTHWAGLPGWSRLFAAADRGEVEPGDQRPQYILGLRSLQLGWFEAGWQVTLIDREPCKRVQPSQLLSANGGVLADFKCSSAQPLNISVRKNPPNNNKTTFGQFITNVFSLIDMGVKHLNDLSTVC